MRPITRFAAMLLGACILGLGSATYLSGDQGAQANGPWRIWTSRVMPGQSPYAIAHHVLSGTLSPDTNQMAVFTAATDSDGAVLDDKCVYFLAGAMPPSRWWSLGIAGDEASRALTSGHVITGPDGAFSATVSAPAAPGNWLAVDSGGPFELVLRLHGPAGAVQDAPERASLPSIRKGECT